MSITLLDIPELPMTYIVRHLPPKSVVNLALSSPTLRKFIQTVNLYVDDYMVEIKEDLCQIRLKFFYVGKPLEWIFSCKRRRKLRSNQKQVVCKDPLGELRYAAEWLCDLISFPIRKVYIVGPDFPGTNDLFNWPALHQCEKISTELMSNLPLNLKAFKDLEKLDVRASFWLKPEHLKIVEISHIHAFCTDWTAQDVNRILRDWKEGVSKKLQTLKVYLKQVENGSHAAILEGLDAKPWDREKRQRIYPTSGSIPELDCGEAMDIEREDGLLASISIDHCNLIFIVWHIRFYAEQQTDQ